MEGEPGDEAIISTGSICPAKTLYTRLYSRHNYMNPVHVHALGVLCCFALFVCLTLLASFFLPSHLSFKNMYMYIVCGRDLEGGKKEFKGSLDS